MMTTEQMLDEARLVELEKIIARIPPCAAHGPGCLSHAREWIDKMADMQGEIIALTPGFEKPALGDVVAVEAVDWGFEGEQLPANFAFAIVYGTIYGKVIKCNGEQITLAFQVFHGGDVRSVLSIPFCTVTKITILEHSDQ